jgi:hypothetical protein
VIAQGNRHFDATLYTGNNTGQTVTNSGGMQPDLLWIKVRSNTYSHVLADAVRGVSPFLASNETTAEGTNSELTSFNSNGFTLGATGSMARNVSGQSYVAWQWRASNAAAVSNTDGSITSTVSANPTAGFSIVTYTGTGAIGTVGHGLGATPAMIIPKNTSGDTNWWVHHRSLTNNPGAYLVLNSTAGSANGISVYNQTNPTSTVFTVGTENGINQSGSTMIAYCFSEVAGYSKFGSYTGNGSADGPFVFCGFRPAFVLMKSSSAVEEWVVFDNKRPDYNATNLRLNPNNSNSEAGTQPIDILANGFKVRGTGSNINTSSGTYIFMAFAESPFRNALAR